MSCLRALHDQFLGRAVVWIHMSSFGLHLKTPFVPHQLPTLGNIRILALPGVQPSRPYHTCLFSIEEAVTPKKSGPRSIRIITYLRRKYDVNQHLDGCQICARNCRRSRLQRRESCRVGAPSGYELGWSDRDQLGWMLAQLRVF